MATGFVSAVAKASETDQPSLMLDFDAIRQAGSVRASNFDPDFATSLRQWVQAGGKLASILRVKVAQTEATAGDNLPDVFGRYEILGDGLRFIPYFPFERRVTYKASFDPRPFGRRELSEILTLEFSLPGEPDTLPPEVTHVFPSSDHLPENLLRFYVRFSNPMQRGRTEAEILLLGPDGRPAADVLYRAPVELWDASMRQLTILLDPGRLKRGVGPNRELGPPLEVGQEYMLVVGSGMVDLSGNHLPKAFHKRFRVTEAVREHVAVEQWRIAPPAAGSRNPLVLMFPEPLDAALLLQAITVISADGQPVAGRIVVDQCEERWSFAPALPWNAGSYHVRVASGLEDPCGNSVMAAFDRPLRPGSDLTYEAERRSIQFHVA
ncbi:hypothetical protein SAMN04488498_106103 [Mesorhizobium albiziae]|uniref:SbsA Ig-like domain-containing protein n=1 Tax=Neomesorhizobium albiziae TaxID=335020 RepID=A0A1I3ZD57_9HYPH|nr:Ig-like domain-containing protein [Mesorhizobium albiziae]GLS32159.1 hypothetical protein GCM10007937_38690 [Mesorhizobium albiziae]SFK41987.1 hypothetical protein SAMN04488498_106103 [Mesorhizobium albiziae]